MQSTALDLDAGELDPAEPLTLPRAAPAPPRPPVPVLTAVVPIAGAVVLWAVTGSAFALWFALLGPLLAAAAVLDGLRVRRRTRRRAEHETAVALTSARAALRLRHERERRRRWERTPDAAGFAAHPHEVWRAVPGRDGVLVVGSGTGASDVRVDGGDGSAAARELVRTARAIDDVPVLVPLTAGVAVVGPPAAAAAVQRALIVQACLSHPPDALRVLDGGEDWIAALPHRQATAGVALAAIDAGRPIADAVDAPIVRVPFGTPPPPRCAAVLTLTSATTARLDHDGESRDVRVGVLSLAQAARLTAFLSERAAASLGRRSDAPVALGELMASAVERAPAGAGLEAMVGVTGGRPARLDLVVDGPHAVVIGTTGAGKSELLTTWVTALCAAYPPQHVSFLLVDFKGGRTFDALAGLPHVTGVLTDLDDATALRAVESLRAEIRHRERELAACGARDVSETAGGLGRLVIVVDEYAALVAAHPELHELFGDLAARGRALGMHLILASQRAAGAFRDAVLANAPLRVALRVTDPADSRIVLGTDRAAALSGAPEARGIALVRRAADTAPVPVRIAHDAAALVADIASAHDGPPVRRPWLPALPARVAVADLPARPGELVLGLADEPDHQRQEPVGLGAREPGLAVVGAAGSGRTTVLRAAAVQAARVVWVPSDLEAAWDAVSRLDEAAPGTLVLVDDVDALLARLPVEHGAELASRLERAAREARTRGIRLIVSAQRLTGPVARIAEHLPQRAVLGMPSRAEHVAAGGDAADFVAGQPPGRGRLGRVLVQFAETAAAPPAPRSRTRSWAPGTGMNAFVAPAGPRTRTLLAQWAAAGVAVVAVDDPQAALAPGTLVWGTPEAWLGQWRLLGAARADAELVVDAACAAEYRTITGIRDLPPYAAPGARRAWWHGPEGDGPRRVRLEDGPVSGPAAAAGAAPADGTLDGPPAGS